MGILRFLAASFRVKAVGVGDAAAPGSAALLGSHQGNRIRVGFEKTVDFGLGTAYASLAAKPNRYIETTISCLERYLAPKHAASCNDYFFHKELTVLIVSKSVYLLSLSLFSPQI